MTSQNTTRTGAAFNPDTLREKYRQERDKRLRDDGNDQYLEIKGTYEHFLDDPYVEPGFTREPLTDEVEVVIIGGGFGGLLTGARLREAGVEDIRFIDTCGDFGGTWYWNRYPGIACDIESYIYLPLLEETGYMPKQKYSAGDEILEHSQRIAKHYDLYRDVCFQTKIEELRWDEEISRWIISTNRGDRMKAHYVAMALGPLNQPKLPGIPGINDFKGHTFHACRWDYDYTGGDSHGNLTGLAGKRVGILGTGATSVQVVPHVGEAAEQLYVFQRTPSSVDVKHNDPTDPEWVKSLKPGWHQHRMDNFNILVSGGFQEEDLVNDGWTEIIRNLLVMVKNEDEPDLSPEELMKKMELADFQKMEQIRARVDEVVEDKETAEALKPYYRQFCKRPCIHNEYLPTFNRPNVTLVDTKGQGVDRITEKGVVVDGKEYEVDCLIYASGFEVGTSYTRRAGYDIIGRGGKSLEQNWSDGVKSFHGMHVKDFPNCFIMSNAQSGFTPSYPHMLNEQAKHIAYILKNAIDNKVNTIETSPDAQKEWIETIISVARGRNDFLQNCTPGYYNNEGKPNDRTAQDGFYGGGSVAFIKLWDDWRAEGSLKGLELS
ncbi:MAG: NAD(P)/FAD-dependent oxidoreductase [Deltaproteobacteria bacterium]|nr:NAD(P)/FAD-dependent oxidoreductase [Deltaproteobacteria bacterium]